jgi:hypothetical protein
MYQPTENKIVRRLLSLSEQTDTIINDLKKNKIDFAGLQTLEELENARRKLNTINADLEELFKNRDDEILKLKEEVSTVSFSKTFAEIITRDKKILELEDRLSKISNKATPNLLSDMQSIMTTFNNARETDTVIFRECVEKISEKFDKMADSMANAGSKHEASTKCFSTTNNEQISPCFTHSVMFVVKKTLFIFNIMLYLFFALVLIEHSSFFQNKN